MFTSIHDSVWHRVIFLLCLYVPYNFFSKSDMRHKCPLHRSAQHTFSIEQMRRRKKTVTCDSCTMCVRLPFSERCAFVCVCLCVVAVVIFYSGPVRQREKKGLKIRESKPKMTITTVINKRLLLSSNIHTLSLSRPGDPSKGCVACVPCSIVLSLLLLYGSHIWEKWVHRTRHFCNTGLISCIPESDTIIHTMSNGPEIGNIPFITIYKKIMRTL